MIFLILSIIFNSYIGLVFKYFSKYNIDISQTIVLNYWVCVFTGIIFNGNFPISISSFNFPWFYWAILMGALFIILFNIIGFSTIKAGATITQAANKLSLAIPVIFSYFLYNDKMNFLKISGIIIAFIAVIFIVWKKNNTDLKKNYLQILLPIILFLGSGAVDTITNYVEKNYILSNKIANAYLISSFLSAAFFGTIFLIFKKEKLKLKNIFAALILGIPNYFSILFLIKALQNKDLSSSATIPINNIGILVLVSFVGLFFLKEKLNKINYAGLFLALCAIILIFLGDS